jgi:cytoskeleton protein RodZ
MSEINNNKVEQEPAELTAGSPGPILRKARQAKNITEQEAVAYLGLTRRTLMALEEDDLCQLPSDTYVRGYIRNYCKMLELSYTETMVGYNKLRGELICTNSQSEELMSRPSLLKARPTLAIIGIVVVVIVGLVVWFFG